jgi:hypothetical protein
MGGVRCSERIRLLSEYHDAAKRYSAAVAEMKQRIGITSRDDYWKLLEAAEKARLLSNEARARLERHLASHNCRFLESQAA